MNSHLQFHQKSLVFLASNPLASNSTTRSEDMRFPSQSYPILNHLCFLHPSLSTVLPPPEEEVPVHVKKALPLPSLPPGGACLFVPQHCLPLSKAANSFLLARVPSFDMLTFLRIREDEDSEGRAERRVLQQAVETDELINVRNGALADGGWKRTNQVRYILKSEKSRTTLTFLKFSKLLDPLGVLSLASFPTIVFFSSFARPRRSQQPSPNLDHPKSQILPSPRRCSPNRWECLGNGLRAENGMVGKKSSRPGPSVEPPTSASPNFPLLRKVPPPLSLSLPPFDAHVQQALSNVYVRR